jgi:hypothetical protein
VTGDLGKGGNLVGQRAITPDGTSESVLNHPANKDVVHLRPARQAENRGESQA